MTESPFKRDISVEINVKPSPCCSEYRFKQILKSIAHFKWYCLNSFTANFYCLSIQLRIDHAVFSKNMFLKASQNIWCKKKTHKNHRWGSWPLRKRYLGETRQPCSYVSSNTLIFYPYQFFHTFTPCRSINF